MLRFILKRLLLIVPTFIGITIIAFAFVRVLPGDPVLLIAGERGVTPERYQALMQQFGYDRPIWEQYWSYLLGIFQGDFGTSISTKRPVIQDFLTLFPATLELSLFAITFAVVIGVPAANSPPQTRTRALRRRLWRRPSRRWRNLRLSPQSRTPSSCRPVQAMRPGH